MSSRCAHWATNEQPSQALMRYGDEPGHVLHTRPWRETSAIVEVLSAHHGRVTLVARGLRTARAQARRAALEPLQWIRFSGEQRGELARLTDAEAMDVAPRLIGDAALAGFYLCELTLRLAPRLDPLEDVHRAFGRSRALIAAGAPLAWTLRRYERDLLAALGVGLDLMHSSDGQPLDPAARYRLDADAGLVRVVLSRSGETARHPTGRVLRALGEDATPDGEELPALRRAMRELLLHHLGGRPLHAWSMAQDLRPGTGAPLSGEE